MYCLNHPILAHAPVGKRKREDLEEVARPKKAKPNPGLSSPLPNLSRTPTLGGTPTSPSISVESSSSDGSRSPDTDMLLLSPPHDRDAPEGYSVRPSASNRQGHQKAERVRGFGSRTISTTSSETDSSSLEPPSDPATVAPDRVTFVPSSSNPPFPLSRHALTSQNLTNLQERLSAFLPVLKTANQALEVDRVEGRLGDRNIEVVSNAEEPYIEMDLSLGILEEKHAGIRLSDRSGSESSDESGSENSNATEEGHETHPRPSPKRGKDKDILGRLMGRNARGDAKSKPKIEVLS